MRCWVSGEGTESQRREGEGDVSLGSLMSVWVGTVVRLVAHSDYAYLYGGSDDQAYPVSRISFLQRRM
jgi:hypothetical protein